MMKKFFKFCTISFVLMATPTMAEDRPGGEQNSAALPAGIITIEREPVPLTVTLSGQALAEEDATIRPLVDGVITDILYRAGASVEKGDPLFQIDQESYTAALEVARAELASAEAAVPSAQVTLSRYEKLVGTGATQAQVDIARTDLRQAQAAVAAAKASVRTAEIILKRTTVASPISGIAATANVSIGDLVTAGQSDMLTTVTRLDPIFVDLSEASSKMLAMRQRIDSGEITRGSKVDAQLLLESGEQYAARGEVVNVGRKVSTSTGTMTVRVKFDNPNMLILPGMFLRVKLTIGHIDAYRIPQLAAKAQPDGTITAWTYDSEQKATQLSLLPVGTNNNAWVVSQGLEGSIPILVDNIDNLQEGTSIKPLAVTINEKGVVTNFGASASVSESNKTQ
ncbi:efflux RND transporter periplasmic adaptor subunit [Neptunomonas sp.]|uniref:efflux RND transporter periplasmic adaptor subunit n=1 Tax=Neptunomonas sp. TaxID=1971898 RepID=UPI00356AB858